jgi:O-antigen ligase
MNEAIDPPPIRRALLALLIIFCLLLPNIHVTALASQVVIPREFLLCLYAVVFVLLLAQQKSFRYNSFFILSFCFLAWQFVALAWSSDIPTGIESVQNAYLFLLCAFAFYQIRKRRIRSLLLNTLIVSISVACFIGVLQNFGWNPLAIYQAEPPSSTFVNKNLAASASLLLLPVTIAQLLLTTNGVRKTLLFIASTLLLAYILIAHTKGVWLAGIGTLFIALMSYLFSNQKEPIRQHLKQNRLHLLGITLLSLALFLAPGVRNAGDFNPDQYTLTSGSSLVRLGFYSDALPLIADHPIIGVGSGSLRYDFRADPDEKYKAQHAEGNKYLARLHNDHLQYLVEHGLVGLALWLAMLFVLFKSTKRHLDNKQIAFDEKLIPFFLLLGITGMLLHAMVSFPLRSVSTGSLFWLCIGILFSYQHKEKTEKRLTLPDSIKYPAVAAMVLASIFAIHNITNRAIGSYFVKQASDMLVSGYCFAAIIYLDNALAVSSLDIRSAQLLAVTYDHCAGQPAEKTIALMDGILAFEPNHSLALLVKGDIAYNTGNTDTAFALYSHVRKVNPLEQRAYLGMARIQAQKNHPQEAINLLKQALEINAKNDTARELLAVYENLKASPE